MAMEFKTKEVDIPKGKGRRSVSSFVTFGSPVKDAVVVLTGFTLSFGNKDHRLNVVEVVVQKDSVSGMTVNFTVQANLADESFNDSYSGSVAAVVIADVMPAARGG